MSATETATLRCAGNRRAGLIAVRDIPGEAPWGPGATGTATWTGVALADVLAVAGPLGEAAHVGFEGADIVPGGEAGSTLRRLDSARQGRPSRGAARLGDERRAAPRSPRRAATRHRARLHRRARRQVARADEMRAEPWQGYFQHVAYRLLPEDSTPGPGAGMPLVSSRSTPTCWLRPTAETVAAGAVEVRGYAFAGGERHVARVDVSLNGGATLVAGGAARRSRPVGLAHVADHGRARSGGARDPRARMGFLGGDAARGGGGALEPEGVRERRAPPGPGPRRLSQPPAGLVRRR